MAHLGGVAYPCQPRAPTGDGLPLFTGVCWPKVSSATPTSNSFSLFSLGFRFSDLGITKMINGEDVGSRALEAADVGSGGLLFSSSLITERARGQKLIQ